MGFQKTGISARLFGELARSKIEQEWKFTQPEQVEKKFQFAHSNRTKFYTASVCVL